MNKKALVIAKINFRFLLPAYIITAVFLLAGVWNLIGASTGITGNIYVEIGNYLYVFAVLAPIFIAGRNFKRIMHLNGKKQDYYWGCLANYIIIAAAASLGNMILFFCSKALFDSLVNIQSLAEIFGWLSHGIVICFIQQFCFLLLTAVFVHMMTEMQSSWLGWLADVLLVVVLSVFIPVPVLRNVLEGFFRLIIFHPNVFIQIGCCLVLTALCYAVDLYVLRRKRI
ncbi:hypothetical protein [Robinsoniella peoriensis]|uniref:hypothetical protein n=1 Tax=Robinsoniella peoriensis TaxID=180332 RepID=UPI00085BDAEF|nr:hypothetical protein [Robinsoniella peoriensis]